MNKFEMLQKTFKVFIYFIIKNLKIIYKLKIIY